MEENDTQEETTVPTVKGAFTLSEFIGLKETELMRLQRIDWQTFMIASGVLAGVFLAARVSNQLGQLAEIVKEMTP